MIKSCEIMRLAEFVADHLGEVVYVIDNLDCDECPDAGGESCPMCRPGFSCKVEVVNKCRNKRAIVRPVSMDVVDIHLEAAEDDVEVIINDCYQRAEVESFFRGRWFASMSGNCGEEIIRTLRKEEARGRQKTVYAVGGHYRAV